MLPIGRRLGAEAHRLEEVHDDEPRFQAWDKRADTFQIAQPYVFGGDTIVNVG